MAQESTFVKIKRIVESEKNKKVSGEARLQSLAEERDRIFKQIKQEFGKEIYSVKELETIVVDLEAKIKDDITKMVEVLKSEGIEV